MSKSNPTLRLFDEQISRKPDLYPWTQEFIKAMHDGFWTDKEFNFQSDIQDFKAAMTAEEREVVTRCLSAIGQIEVAVKKFWAKLGDNLPHPSITDLGYVMANVEVIHNNAYERLLKVLDMESVFEENLKLEIISGRVEYLRKYLHKYYKDSKKQYIYSLILFTLFVENVSLFSQFYVILWMGRYRNVLKDTNNQVNYTKNEELLHAQVGIKLVNVLREEYPELFDQELEDLIARQCLAAFEKEEVIIEWMLNGYTGPRLNPDVLKDFVKYQFNYSLVQIGYKPVFTTDPVLERDYEWMIEEMYGNGHKDFFHGRGTGYSKKDRPYTADDLF